MITRHDTNTGIIQNNLARRPLLRHWKHCLHAAHLHNTVYPKKYAHGFVVLRFVVVMQSFIMNSHEVFIHIHQGCFAGTGAIVRLPQCQWSKPDGYGKISQCITTTKHSKAKTVYIFLGIYCISLDLFHVWVMIFYDSALTKVTKMRFALMLVEWNTVIKYKGVTCMRGLMTQYTFWS